MFGHLVRRVLIMIPTLIAISVIVFTIIQLPPGDYLSSYVAELQSQGESVSGDKVAFLREQYGFDKPMWQQYAIWAVGMLHGDYGYSFEYNLPVSEVVGDRLWLTFMVSFSTILFTWAVSFPIGVYSAVRQYSIGDYVLTFIGFLGLATPSFLLALVLLYLANNWFGTSIGGLMDPTFIGKPWSWAKLVSVLEHLWVPVVVIGTAGTAGTNGTPMFFVDQSPTNALATGDSQTYEVQVMPGAQSQALRVTLAWTDPPGNPAAAIKLVNNLDVVVTNTATGEVYYANNFTTSGTPPYTLPAATNAPPPLDYVNNVRNIFIP